MQNAPLTRLAAVLMVVRLRPEVEANPERIRMMRMRLAFAAALLLSLGAVSAQALPAAPVQAGLDASEDVTLVAGGCGPGWYRNAYGACRPMRRAPGVYVAPGVAVVPPVVVAPRVVPRACGRGMYLNRYGRCVWR